MLDWRDVLVVLFTVLVTIVSSFRLPSAADELFVVRLAVGLHIAVGVGIAAAFQDYYDQLNYSVAWLEASFGLSMPVIAYLISIALGFLTLGHTILVTVLSKLTNITALTTVSSISILGQLGLFTHTLSIGISSPVAA